ITSHREGIPAQRSVLTRPWYKSHWKTVRRIYRQAAINKDLSVFIHQSSRNKVRPYQGPAGQSPDKTRRSAEWLTSPHCRHGVDLPPLCPSPVLERELVGGRERPLVRDVKYRPRPVRLDVVTVLREPRVAREPVRIGLVVERSRPGVS